jgi:hypothetical protein
VHQSSFKIVSILVRTLTFCFKKNFNIICAWHISCFSRARTPVDRTPNAQVSGEPLLEGA